MEKNSVFLVHLSETFMFRTCPLNQENRPQDCSICCVLHIVTLENKNKMIRKNVTQWPEKSSCHRYSCNTNVTLKYQVALFSLWIKIQYSENVCLSQSN